MTAGGGLSTPRWLWWALGGLGLLGALLYQLPASVMGRLLQVPDVVLADYAGTLWNGRAGRVVADGVEMGALSWKVAGPPLLLARLRADLELAGTGVLGQGRIERRVDGALKVDQASGRLPAGWLQHIVDLPQLGLLGEVEVNIHQARLDRDGWLVALDGTARWQAARIAGLAGNLGDLELTWRTLDEGTVEGQLSDAGGPLALSGKVRLANRHYRVQLRLAPRDGSVALRQALASLGRAGADGAVRLEINGPLVPLKF